MLLLTVKGNLEFVYTFYTHEIHRSEKCIKNIKNTLKNYEL